MRQEDIREGLYVRLLAVHLGLPAGTLGMVETVTTKREGEFCFTLRWLNAPSGTRSRPISDRSLNLWRSDLERIEPVSSEDVHAILSARSPAQSKRAKPMQLRLFENI